MFSIGIEDLVANALIETVEKTGKRSVSFLQLIKYENAILTNLTQNNKMVRLNINRDATNQFFHNYSDIFTITEYKDDVVVSLNNNISTAYLRSNFRINLALPLITAFVSKEAVNILL